MLLYDDFQGKRIRTTCQLLHMQQLYIQRFTMYAVTEVTNEQYKEPTGSRLFEVWESGLAKPPSVAIRSLHNVVNRYLRVTRPEAAEDISNGNVDVIVYLARHDNEEIFPQDIEQRFGVTRSTSCRVLGLMEQNMEALQIPIDVRQAPAALASTDVGNLSHCIPAIQCMIGIGSPALPHTPAFAQACAGEAGAEIAVRAAKVLACTVIDLLENPELVKKAREELAERKRESGGDV